MRHYATLCDSKYLPRALAMVESIERHSSEQFFVHLLAMDPATLAAVNAFDLHYLQAYSWEGSDVREDHTWQEYCWLMASQWCEWLMNVEPIAEITYVDADGFFFADPETIHLEIGSRGIGIIPHRFIPSKRYLSRNGEFNVGFVTFKFNSKAGMECLTKWAADCREWCYARNEDGKFGDQKYLDEWPEKYGDEVCVIQNIGAGAAPWNLAHYSVTEGPKVDGVPVVFFHAHEFLPKDDGTYRLTNYALRPEDKEFIYKPYIAAYEAAKRTIETVRLQPN